MWNYKQDELTPAKLALVASFVDQLLLGEDSQLRIHAALALGNLKHLLPPDAVVPQV